MSGVKHQATRQDVLDAIEKFKPFGPDVSLEDLDVVTSTEKSISGMPRVFVRHRVTKQLLYDGGVDGSNWHLVKWCRERWEERTGRSIKKGFDFKDLEPAKIEFTYDKMKLIDIDVIRDMIQRWEWLREKEAKIEAGRQLLMILKMDVNKGG
jgi:hypothetical protein